MPTPRSGRPETGPGHYLRDIVYGALDGVITTMAIVAGAFGAGLGGGVALVLGLANIVADGLSMGASNYLGLKSELQQTGRSVRREKPWRHGAATLAAFVVVGGFPLLALVPAIGGDAAAPLAAGLGVLALVAVGAARARFIPGRSSFFLGFEMLAVGATAAAAAFAIGYAARSLVP